MNIKNAFRIGVFLFSSLMTFHSIKEAFGGGVVGWIFGFFSIFLFEGAALYWMYATKDGREMQIGVAQTGQWVSITLSLASTAAGVALITTWGDGIRDSMPLGVIMIVLMTIGLATNLFGFVAYDDLEPSRMRANMQRKIEAAKAKMVADGDMRVLKEAQLFMEQKVSEDAPALGKQLADAGFIVVKENAARNIAKSAPERGGGNQQRQEQRPQLPMPPQQRQHEQVQRFAAEKPSVPPKEPYDPSYDVDDIVTEKPEPQRPPNPQAAKGPHAQRK